LICVMVESKNIKDLIPDLPLIEELTKESRQSATRKKNKVSLIFFFLLIKGLNDHTPKHLCGLFAF
jgi:hypothetical protein